MCTSECKRGRKVCLRDTLSHSSPNQAREKTTKHNCSHSPSRSVARVTRFVILASIKYSKGLSGHGAQSWDWRPKSRCAGGGGRGLGGLLAPCPRAVPPRWAPPAISAGRSVPVGPAALARLTWDRRARLPLVPSSGDRAEIMALAFLSPVIREE